MKPVSTTLHGPQTDPTPIFELYRGSYGSELLTAAIAHLGVFARLARGPLAFVQLQNDLQLADRAMLVLLTALRAMGLVEIAANDLLQMTPLAREHLSPDAPFDVGDYIGLAASSPGVLEMVERLRTDRPAGLDQDGAGTAFIYRAGVASAMEQQELAHHFTLALAGRAKNVAPVLARHVPLDGAMTLLDVGAGTGIYSIAYLRQQPELRTIVLDRPEVVKIAREFAREYRVEARMEFVAADMFEGPLPTADAVLLSNVLHDWGVDACRDLVRRCRDALTSSGRLIIHDVLLNDALDGPLPIALYSAALFTLTEGLRVQRARIS